MSYSIRSLFALALLLPVGLLAFAPEASAEEGIRFTNTEPISLQPGEAKAAQVVVPLFCGSNRPADREIANRLGKHGCHNGKMRRHRYFYGST